MPKPIRRLVLNFPGFEPTTAERQIGRLSSGGEKTASLWGFELKTGQVEHYPDSHKTVMNFHSSASKWASETRYVHYSWGDIIEKYDSVPYPQNLFRHMGRYTSFFTDGTVGKYFRASARYWGFTIYPLLLMLLFALLAWVASGFLISFLGGSWLLQVILAIVVFLVLCKYPGDRFYINTSINDWAFARDMCRRSNPEIEERYAEFGKSIADELEASDFEEIIIVGHSFGSIWAIMALSKAIEGNPLLLDGRRITFLALGSSLLKIALSNEATFLRKAVNKVVETENLLWHEIQTKTDFVSFYKSEPLEPIGIKNPNSEVLVHRVNFKKALSKDRHRKMMKSMYLAHRQYILYCDKPVHHDYQLRIFGPFFAADLARDANLALQSPLINLEV